MAKFQKLVRRKIGQFFRRKQKVVRTAQLFIILFVFADIFEKRIHRLFDIRKPAQLDIVVKTVDQLVFVILGNAVNVVVMRIKSSAADLRAFAKLAHGNLSELHFLRKHFGEHLFNRFSRLSGRIIQVLRFHFFPFQTICLTVLIF